MQRLLRGEEQRYAACLEENIPLLYTTFQTAGRGQSGNGWEAERGKNLLLTYLLREPETKATEQFRLNIIASVVTHRTVLQWLPAEQQAMLQIKWPNDIYFGDRKIAGILVENSLSGNIVKQSITGIGININQEHWVGNAPNPVSLKQITGKDTDIEDVMHTFSTMLRDTLSWKAEQCKSYYMHHLYRREGSWLFAEREVSTTPTRIVRADEGQLTFEAQIRDISENGTLCLQATGETAIRNYHFKQIQFVL